MTNMVIMMVWIRNAYYVSDGKGRYISFDGVANKYMMKSVPTPSFLKENNCMTVLIIILW